MAVKRILCLKKEWHKQNETHLFKKIYQESKKTYMAISKGSVIFTKDFILYLKIKKDLKSTKQNYSKLIRKDIELYHQMPKDVIKVFFTLFLASLPVVFYFILPALYAFPKQLLCSHFWTNEQKRQFRNEYLRKRLSYNDAVLSHLELKANKLTENPMYDCWKNILSKLRNCGKSSAEEIIKCNSLFKIYPYVLQDLETKHVKHLAKIHEIGGWHNLKTKLKNRALLLMEMDKAILREGGVHNMSLNVLENACYIRGLNPNGESVENLINWLNEWIKISSQSNITNLSMLIHCPVLMGCNEKSNLNLLKNHR